MFRQITVDLNDEYRIQAIKRDADFAIEILKQAQVIGSARLVTDNVDVSCITSIQIDDNEVNTKLTERLTLADAVIKFLLKFPSVVRKPEFRFILDVPANLSDLIMQHHF